MTTARILAAFYQPRAKRFVALTGDELRQRSGIPPGHPTARTLIANGTILRERINMAYPEWILKLSPAGERQALAMPQEPRLTANPGRRG